MDDMLPAVIWELYVFVCVEELEKDNSQQSWHSGKEIYTDWMDGWMWEQRWMNDGRDPRKTEVG